MMMKKKQRATPAFSNNRYEDDVFTIETGKEVTTISNPSRLHSQVNPL